VDSEGSSALGTLVTARDEQDRKKILTWITLRAVFIPDLLMHFVPFNCSYAAYLPVFFVNKLRSEYLIVKSEVFVFVIIHYDICYPVLCAPFHSRYFHTYTNLPLSRWCRRFAPFPLPPHAVTTPPVHYNAIYCI